jgi:hypothetical protein
MKNEQSLIKVTLHVVMSQGIPLLQRFMKLGYHVTHQTTIKTTCHMTYGV